MRNEMLFLRRRNVRAQLRRLRRGVVLFLSWVGRDVGFCVMMVTGIGIGIVVGLGRLWVDLWISGPMVRRVVAKALNLPRRDRLYFLVTPNLKVHRTPITRSSDIYSPSMNLSSFLTLTVSPRRRHHTGHIAYAKWSCSAIFISKH
jgi:hypothetical protein